jgi:hypothetical protein
MLNGRSCTYKQGYRGFRGTVVCNRPERRAVKIEAVATALREVSRYVEFMMGPTLIFIFKLSRRYIVCRRTTIALYIERST